MEKKKKTYNTNERMIISRKVGKEKGRNERKWRMPREILANIMPRYEMHGSPRIIASARHKGERVGE